MVLSNNNIISLHGMALISKRIISGWSEDDLVSCECHGDKELFTV